MTRFFASILIAAVLGGCVIIPADYGYGYGDGGYGHRGYWDGHRDGQRDWDSHR